MGLIVMFGGNYAPPNWAFCDGQIMPISNYQALYSILGTTYGGDGRTNFALPDLRGRVPLHSGNGNPGPGLTPYPLGQRGGSETQTLTESQMPTHTHSAQMDGGLEVSESNGSTGPSSDTYLGAGAGLSKIYTTDTGSGTTQIKGLEDRTVQVGQAGGGSPFDLRQPYLAVNFEIVMMGIYPPHQ